MKSSEKLEHLIPALFRVQGKLRRVVASKENLHLKSKYAPLAEVWESVLPILQEEGLLVTHLPNAQQMTEIECVVWHAETQEFLSSSLMIPLAEVKGTSDAQRIGSAITYAQRYTLRAMLEVMIGDEDDDGDKAGRDDWTSKEQRFDAMVAAVTKCTTVSALRDLWNTQAGDRLNLDPDRLQTVTQAFTETRKGIEGNGKPTAVTVPPPAAASQAQPAVAPANAPAQKKKTAEKKAPSQEPAPAPEAPKEEPKAAAPATPKPADVPTAPPSGGWGDLFND